MMAAREKAIEKYGGKIEDHVNLIINDGDQVDAGTLDQYEHVHFEQSAVLVRKHSDHDYRGQS